jgi:hypothetical protein
MAEVAAAVLRQRGRREVAIKVDDFPQSAFTVNYHVLRKIASSG